MHQHDSNMVLWLPSCLNATIYILTSTTEHFH